jgi:hypothetical protein
LKQTLLPKKRVRRLKEGEKKPNTLKFVQINLHHSKAAMEVLRQQLTDGVPDV